MLELVGQYRLLISLVMGILFIGCLFSIYKIMNNDKIKDKMPRLILPIVVGIISLGLTVWTYTGADSESRAKNKIQENTSELQQKYNENLKNRQNQELITDDSDKMEDWDKVREEFQETIEEKNKEIIYQE